MKRLAIAVCILILTLTFSAFSYFTVCSRIDSVIRLLEDDRKATLTSGESDPARTKEILKKWDSNEKYLVSMLTHHELEEIEISIRCLRDYSSQGLTEEYLKTLNECINRLEHVKATEKPDTKNIF